ncbi:MAG: helix-turn-helix transcriptional regulator [Rikenellaceae bacterium]
MADNEQFKKVVSYLKSQGLIESQDDLAQKLGYNPDYLSHIASGLKPVSNKLADKICSICNNISCDYLLGKNPNMLSVGVNDLGDMSGGNIAGRDIKMGATTADFIKFMESRDELIRELMKSKDEQINKLIAQIDKLIELKSSN